VTLCTPVFVLQVALDVRCDCGESER